MVATPGQDENLESNPTGKETFMNANPAASNCEEDFFHFINEAPCNFAWAQHVINTSIPLLCAAVTARQMLDKLKDRVLESDREQFDATIAAIEQAISLWRGKGRVTPDVCRQCIHQNYSAEQALQHIAEVSMSSSQQATKPSAEMRCACPYFTRSSASGETPSEPS